MLNYQSERGNREQGTGNREQGKEAIFVKISNICSLCLMYIKPSAVF
jgi:hypothetical protein